MARVNHRVCSSSGIDPDRQSAVVKGQVMTSIGALKSVPFLCAVLFLAGCATQTEAPPVGATGNPISGAGLPNPAPNVTRNWGTLPEGRQWGSSAGADIDPADGHIWVYERCGAGNFGAG